MDAAAGPVLIDLFEVPAGAEDDFVAGWARARDFLAERGAFRTTTLHRALEPASRFAFVEVAEIPSVETWRAAVGDPGFPRDGMPGRPHPGLYAIAHDEAPVAPPEDGVVLVNPFAVPEPDDEDFARVWLASRDAVRGRPGDRGARLHHALAPGPDFRWVAMAWWDGPREFRAALGTPEFRESATGFRHRSHPALYRSIAA